MDETTVVFIAFMALIFTTICYAVKRNFDENALYIANGYHMVSGTNATWVK